MKKLTAHDWFQAIGMASVVGSLIFVGLQLRQSQEIAIAAQYQARLDAASDAESARACCKVIELFGSRSVSPQEESKGST